MSEIMYDKVPDYQKGDYKKYVIWDENNIKGFFGEYRWLSNFYPCRVWYEGLEYLNSECAYQGAKVEPEYRKEFTFCSAYESKSLWKKFPKQYGQHEWDLNKKDIMSSIVFEKFYRNLELRQKLLETTNKHLEELNHWGCSFWGVDINLGGKNNLGKILMGIRKYWQDLS